MPPIRYRFVAGRGDERQLQEVNALADSGYKVINMVHNDPATIDHRQILVLMEYKRETR